MRLRNPRSLGGTRPPEQPRPEAGDPPEAPADADQTGTARSDRDDRTGRASDPTGAGSGRAGGSGRGPDRADRAERPDRADRQPDRDRRPADDPAPRSRPDDDRHEPRRTGDDAGTRTRRTGDDAETSSRRSGDETGTRPRRTGEETGNRPRRTGDDTGSADDNRPGGSRTPRPDGTADLRTRGPFVPHFHGRVEKVFGTTPRPAPSWRPVLVASALLAAAFALPYAIALLPVIALVLVLVLWLRHRGLFRGGMRGPRYRQDRPDSGLQSTTFRVRILADDGRTAFTTLDCRLVQKADAGPVTLASGDTVTGRGRRSGRDVVEVARLDVGDPVTTSLASTNPKSNTPVLVLAGLLTVAAAGVVYLGWDSVAPISWESVLLPVVSALVPLLVIYVIVKKVILRR